MPVTIGVFVRPGELPAAVKGTIGRRNRCFEYDGVGDNNVRFLVDELLPFVAQTVRPEAIDQRQRSLHRRRQQRRDRGVQRGVGTSRRVQPRLCQQRELRRLSRRP